jgi:hypothetical protein
MNQGQIKTEYYEPRPDKDRILLSIKMQLDFHIFARWMTHCISKSNGNCGTLLSQKSMHSFLKTYNPSRVHT